MNNFSQMQMHPRVVHIITRFIRGGADENTLLTCNGQVALGYEIHLVVGAETHPDILMRLDKRVMVHTLPSLIRSIHPVKDICAFWYCFTLIQFLKPDIVHTHESKAGILGRWAAWLARVPCIIHGVHILAFVGGKGVSRFFYRAVERATSFVTSAFIDVSEGMKAECLAVGIGREDNHFVISSGMDIERFRRTALLSHQPNPLDTSILAEELRTGPVQFLLMAGALEPRKRVLEFLPVFARVIEDIPRAVLLVCGEGPLMANLHKRIASLGLSGRVLPLGHRDDLEFLIAISDVCVHAAEREGLPRVVVQFVAGRKPVVTTDLPGIERVVINGVNGIIVPRDDLSALGAHVTGLLHDKEKCAAMSQNAALVDLSAWDADHMVLSIHEVYRSLTELPR